MSDEISEAVEAAPEVSALESAVESMEDNSSENAEISAESSENSEVAVQAETESELEAELEQAIEEGASEEEVKSMIREFTLKVNGKEYIKQVDLGDEDSLKNELQMALAGRQAMQKNSELEKVYQNEIERLKSDPWSVLEELGLDPIELAASRIESHLEQSKKSPEQLESESRIKEYEEMKAENERLKEEYETSKRQEELAKAEKEIESDIISTLDGDSDLEATPELINMVVDNMLYFMDNGFEDVTAKDVLPSVKKELQQKYRSYAKSMKSTTALKSLLGDDILNSLREERLEKAKNHVTNVNNIQPTAAPEKKEESTKKRRKLSDFMGM